MSTGEKMAGRVIATLGGAFGLTYLGWRITSTLDGAPWWLGLPTLAVEIVGVVAALLLSWALWRAPETARSLPARAPEPDDASTASPAELFDLDAEIVVRCSGQDAGALRATLLVARRLAPVLVVDLDARPEIAAVAVETGSRYLATDPEDVDGLIAAAHAVDAASFLFLEAGDIPHPAILRSLAPWFDEASVAIVQGPVVASETESAEHGAGGRHDKDVDRRAFVPALGARGVAPFTGSGALIRRAAVLSLGRAPTSPSMMQAEITSALFAGGWQLAAPGGHPVVAVVPVARPADVENLRACEASAARHLVFGSNGALRGRRLSLDQRLSLAAQAVRPLAGLRRGVVIALLIGALLAGRLPFDADPVVFAALWGPWFVLSAIGLFLLSDGALRPGDRVRWSMRVLGASWRGVAAPDGRPDPAEHVLGSAFGLHHGVASAGAVAAISIVIGLRALSDRVTHTLAPMPLDETAALLLAALWSLGGGLDALRILARRAQTRRATRVVSSLPSTFADRAALVVDLTPLGAGVLNEGGLRDQAFGEVDLAIGSQHVLEVVLPTASGCISATVPAVVRNVRTDFSGERRFGVEFGAVDPFVADALIEYCVVQPALELLGGASIDPTLVGARPVVVLDDHPILPRRVGLRAAALVAVVGAMASAVPTAEAATSGIRVQGAIEVAAPAAIDATVPETAPDTVVSPETDPASTVPTVDTEVSTGIATPVSTLAPVADPVASPAGAVVVAVCSSDPGADGAWGTADDAYSGPVSTVVGDDGAYSLDLVGTACWATVAPPVGLMVRGETSELESPTTPQVIDLPAGSWPTISLVAATRSETTGPTVTIDDVVWADVDADGVVDGNERGVAAVAVALVDGNGVVVDSTVTAADGRFTFAGAADTTYRVQVTNLPAGYVAPEVFGRSEPFTMALGTDVNLAIGLRPSSVPVADAVTRATPPRLLVAPETDQLARPPVQDSSLGALLVVLLATLIGVSVVAGSLRPSRRAFAPTVPRLS